MIQRDSLDIILESSGKTSKIFSPAKKGIYFQKHMDEAPVQLFEGNVLEFDMDIDLQGNMGLVILNHSGKLYYYYYNGKMWTSYLLHQLNLQFEQVKDIRIQLTSQSPHILFCWRNQTSSGQWSIMTYHHLEHSWKKEMISKIYCNSPITPYTVAKDKGENLYLFYLSNNNLVYDLNFVVFSSQSQKWSQPVFLSNCIFIKYFHMDALIDHNGGMHVVWIDKYKKNYCVKYIHKSSLKSQQENPSVVMQFHEPLLWSHLYLTKQHVHCYGITGDHVYHSSKPIKNIHSLSKWQSPRALDYDDKDLFLYKIVGHAGGFQANYALSNDACSYRPIYEERIEEQPNIPLHTQQAHASDAVPGDDQILKLKAELFKKNHQIEASQNLLKTLQGEMAFIKEEIKNLHEQQKKYAHIFNEYADKYKRIHEHVLQTSQVLENHCLQLDHADWKKKIEIIFEELKKLKADVDFCTVQNKELKSSIENLQNGGLFRKLFS